MNIIALSGEKLEQFKKMAIELAMSINCKSIPFDESDYTWEVIVN